MLAREPFSVANHKTLAELREWNGAQILTFRRVSPSRSAAAVALELLAQIVLDVIHEFSRMLARRRLIAFFDQIPDLRPVVDIALIVRVIFTATSPSERPISGGKVSPDRIELLDILMLGTGVEAFIFETRDIGRR